MNFILHQRNIPKYVKRIPTNLPVLMEDIIREVLRSQPKPENIYEFISDYLESLIAARDKTTIVRSIIDDVLDMSSFISENLNQLGISSDKANNAAKVIQKNFRSYMEKQQSQYIPFIEAEILSELLNKCNFTCEEILQSTSAIRNAFQNFATEYMRILKGSLQSEDLFVRSVESTFETYSKQKKDLEFICVPVMECLPETKLSCDSFDIEELVLLIKRNRGARIIQRNFRNYMEYKKSKEISKNSEIATDISVDCDVDQTSTIDTEEISKSSSLDYDDIEQTSNVEEDELSKASLESRDSMCI